MMKSEEYFDKKYGDKGYHIRDIIECNEPITLWEFIEEYAKHHKKIGGLSFIKKSKCYLKGLTKK